MNILEILNERLLHSYGLTEISRSGPFVVISHGGNMGNTEQRSVAPNVDKMLGKGAFAFLRQHGQFLEDRHGNVHDDPSYSYVLKVPVEHYNAWTQQRPGLSEADDFGGQDPRELYREARQHVRDAINHMNFILVKHYDRGARYETPDRDTLVRLARAASMLDNVNHALAAGTPDDKPDPMDV